MKVELVPGVGLWSRRRFDLRVDWSKAEHLPAASLTQVFQRLPAWLARRV
jgi:hypothetical protein